MKTDLKIAYIGGGSRNWARTIMTDLALQQDFGGEMRLFDIDSQAALDNAIIGNMIASHKDAKSKWHYTTCNDIKSTLSGVDFVIMSILPGTFDEMESYVHTPESYGILQTVGDTAGPAGILRSMIAVPIHEYYAEAIKEYCPNAYVINFTNPMTIITATLYDVFPDIKAYGCCHEVFGLLDLFLQILKDKKGIEIQRQELDFDVFGVNHFTWITRAEYKGIDIFSLYNEYIDENAYIINEDIKTNPFATSNQIKFDLFRRYGQIAAAGDRHLVEFLNNNWYLTDRETIKKWGYTTTPVSWRKNYFITRCESTKNIISGKEQLTLKNSNEEACKLIAGLAGIIQWKTNVNMINKSNFDFAPKNWVVETNVIFNGSGAHQVSTGTPLNDGVKTLVSDVALRQQALLKAIRSRDVNAIFNCFMKEPLCYGLTLPKGRELFEKLFKESKNYLTEYKLDLKGL